MTKTVLRILTAILRRKSISCRARRQLFPGCPVESASTFQRFNVGHNSSCLSPISMLTFLMIRNIIFDWSGTLVDDLPAVLQASNFVLTQAGKNEMTLEEFRAEFSLPFTNFYSRHTPHVPMPQIEEWFHAEFKRAQTSVREL